MRSRFVKIVWWAKKENHLRFKLRTQRDRVSDFFNFCFSEMPIIRGNPGGGVASKCQLQIKGPLHIINQNKRCSSHLFEPFGTYAKCHNSFITVVG